MVILMSYGSGNCDLIIQALIIGTMAEHSTIQHGTDVHRRGERAGQRPEGSRKSDHR